jgi:hypothetical protein
MTIERCFRKHIMPIGLVLLIGIIAYSNSLNAPFQFDDSNISDKAKLLSRAHLATARQVVDFSFLLNHYIHGKDVFGFHLFNLFIHLCTAVTTYYLSFNAIRALVGSNHEDSEESLFVTRFIPFATALLFVCHPIQTESVTYIVQRYTSLATLFYLLSTLMFIRARICHNNDANSYKTWLYGSISLLSGMLAMRSKEIAFTLPFMLAVVEMFLFQGKLLRNRIFLSALIALLLIIPAQQILRHGFTGINDLFYSISRGTREELTYSRTDYLITEFRVVVTYLRLMFFPVNQNLDYDYPLQKIFFTPAVILSLMLHISIVLSSIFMFFKSRSMFKSRKLYIGTCLRLCSLGIVWFYLALSVESSFIPILDVIFEHRLYLPSVGFFLSVTSGAVLVLYGGRTSRKAAWLALALICLIFTTATIRRNVVWGDELRLWEDTARKSPNKIRVLNNLGAFSISKFRPEKAILPLLRVLEIQPGYTESINNIGLLLDHVPQVAGRYNSGKKYMTPNRILDVRQIDPWFANSRNNLGLAYMLTGNPQKALAYFEQSVSLEQKEEAPWLNLALLSMQLGNTKRATEAFDRLKKLNPGRAKLIEPHIFK